ncbi:MAG: Hsp20/alpha crystallin family protein [Burkholderiaceae bacterium]
MRLEKQEGFRQGFASVWESVADGWRRIRQSATSALTRFRPTGQAALPAKADVDDDFYFPSHGWSMLGGDLFEDEHRLVVRLEVPGMDKDAIDIEVLDDVLVVSGEKHFERERTEGRYRMLQCAYGSFRRVIPLPAAVLSDHAKASYERGVLKVELTKAARDKPRVQRIRVN